MTPFILFTNYHMMHYLSLQKKKMPGFTPLILSMNCGIIHQIPFPGMKYIVVLCFVSGVYAVDFPMNIRPPQTIFAFHIINDCYGRKHMFCRYDFGEELHMVTFKCTLNFESCEYGLQVGNLEDHYPTYKALVKEGWLICLRRENELLAAEICNIFCSELMKQRWLSRAWTQLQVEFSTAGCQITKIYRHYNTCFVEEDSGLTWNRRRCLFADDHALLLEYPTRKRSSKHSFLAYPGLHLGLEAGAVANLYEISIFMSIKGKLIHSRKLQEIVSINQQQVRPALNILLQGNASHCTLATLHRKKLRDEERFS